MNRPRIDAYTKTVLTVIAVCLLWLCVDRGRIIAPASGKTTAQRQNPTTYPATDVVRQNRLIREYLNRSRREPDARWVVAESFILVDRNGKKRAELTTLPTTGTVLRFRPVELNGPTLDISLSPTFPSIILRGEFPAYPENATFLQRMESRDKAHRIRLGVVRDGANISITHKNKQDGMRLSVMSGMSWLSLSDKNGIPRANLLVMRDGSPSLRLSDGKYTRAALGVTDMVSTQTGEQAKTAPSSLVLSDKAGKVLWRAP